jgi:magnesium chelatase family protein
VEKHCKLEEDGHRLLANVLSKYRLSGRAHDSVLKISRTIADLAAAATIGVQHLAEAVNYRCFDRELHY